MPWLNSKFLHCRITYIMRHLGVREKVKNDLLGQVNVGRIDFKHSN